MSAHTPGTKPLTQREQRTLDRLQIKWSKKTITAEEKAHALALSNRAWLAEKAAEAPMNISLLVDAAALLAPFVEGGVPIQRGEARDLLKRLRSARAAASSPGEVTSMPTIEESTKGSAADYIALLNERRAAIVKATTGSAA